ncbi:MAG: hypothetical protein LW855_06305, partial [Alphaproteobacteria bacterium]|nr:hypothetical protein [Alphaproteobacteria bacterium]
MALVDATQPVTEYLLDGNDSAKNLFREIENQSPQEALRLILAALERGAIEAEQAIGLMPLDIVQGLMFGSVDPQEGATILGQHTLKTPGAGAGVIVTSADAARVLLEEDSAAKFVLLLHETTAEDIDVLKKAQGVITLSGGSSSHASIIARQFGIPGLIGFNTCDLDSIYAGLSVTIDGSAGVLYEGEETLIPGVIQDIKQGNLAGIPAYFLRVLQIAEQLKAEANGGMAVLANTDDEKGAAIARGLFAQGIGVVRTEHMFFAPAVLKTVQALFLTNDAQQRQQYCDKLAPQQQEDFKAILLAMDGLPVTV